MRHFPGLLVVGTQIAATGMPRVRMLRILVVEDNEMNRDMLTRRLEAAPETHDIPVIALTAHATSRDRETGAVRRCDDYDTKPTELAGLLEKIEALLAARTR